MFLGQGLLVTALLIVAGPLEAEYRPYGVAVLQGLDKVTARVSTIEAPLDESVRFGSLEIVARSCQEAPPEEPPESAAFLEIVDARPDQEPVTVFTGWMFASTPALSALEHPVYDVWVVDCKAAEPLSAAEDDGAEEGGGAGAAQ